MKKISSREKLLVIITASLLIGGIFYQFGVTGIVSSWVDVNENLKKEKSLYESNVMRIQNRDAIMEAYNRFAQVSFRLETSDRPVQAVFSEYVDKVYRETTKMKPFIEPPKREEIEGVVDYEFLSLEVHVEGKIADISSLLNRFEEMSLLVTEITLSLDERSDTIKGRIKVSLIVKKEEETNGKGRPIRSRPGRERRDIIS